MFDYIIFLTNEAVHSISINNTFFKITHSGVNLKDVADIRPECKCDILETVE